MSYNVNENMMGYLKWSMALLWSSLIGLKNNNYAQIMKCIQLHIPSICVCSVVMHTFEFFSRLLNWSNKYVRIKSNSKNSKGEKKT